MTTVRVRGIYTTAITHRLERNGLEVVQASDPIQERFDDGFETAPADVRIETTRDRQGLEVSGDREAVETVLADLEDLEIDTFRWDDDAPRGAVFDAEVIDAGGGGGATVDLGDGRRGYLPTTTSMATSTRPTSTASRSMSRRRRGPTTIPGSSQHSRFRGDSARSRRIEPASRRPGEANAQPNSSA